MKKKMAAMILVLMVFLPANTVKVSAAAPVVSARNAYMMDYETGRTLYEKAPEQRVAMASTTKIMTAIITLERASYDETTTVSQNAAAITGSSMNLRQGEVITVKNLLYGLMLPSGNDAAVALAEHIGGSVEEFCAMMNLKAIQLGAKNTSFTSPHGLDDDNHYTTAKDLAVIAKYAMENIEFRKIVSTKSIDAGGHALRNTNDLLFSMDEVDGIKTGYTGNAERCIVLTAERSGHRIIAVLLGCGTSESRSSDGRKLVNYGLSEYFDYEILKPGDIMGNIKVKMGVKDQVSVITLEQVMMTLSLDEKRELKLEPVLPGEFDAPVHKDQVVGKLRIISNGVVLKEVDLVVSEYSRRKDFTDYMGELMKKWVMVPIWEQLKS